MAKNNSINSSTKITTFIASGTWTIDPRTKFVSIFGNSSGASGSSGRQGATTAAGGGGGGSSSTAIWCDRIPYLLFSSSETVTIGGTAAGALGQTTNLTDGNNGVVNNTTSIGNIIAGPESSAALGGRNGNSTVGAHDGTCHLYPSSTAASAIIATNVAGGMGTLTVGSNAVANVQSSTNICPFAFSTSGGGGSGADAVTARQAGSGGAVVFVSTTIVAASAGGIEGGTIGGALGTSITTPNEGLYYGGTGGGGGGGQSIGASAGAGGNGGTPGGGGGGGGGSISLTTSGAGGNGARGEVIIIEFF